MFLTRTEVADYLEKHDHYCILTHRRPDGDTVGSAVGLCLGLRAMDKDAVVLYNPEITPRYEPLMEGLTVKEPREGDLIVAVDVAEDHMLPKAHGYLRRELGRALNLRYTPELAWELDDSITYGAKMLKLINSLEVGNHEGTDEA